jgi:hypothetical protein
MRLVAGEPSGFGPLVFFFTRVGCLDGSGLLVFRGIFDRKNLLFGGIRGTSRNFSSWIPINLPN